MIGDITVNFVNGEAILDFYWDDEPSWVSPYPQTLYRINAWCHGGMTANSISGFKVVTVEPDNYGNAPEQYVYPE